MRRTASYAAPMGYKKPVFGVAFHPGGQWLALSSDRHADDRMGEVEVWDIESGAELPLTIPIREPQEVYRLAFSPDGRLLVTAGNGNTATVYHFPTGEPLCTLFGHENDIWGLAFGRDGRRIVTSSTDGTVKLWEPATGKCLRTFRPPSGSINVRGAWRTTAVPGVLPRAAATGPSRSGMRRAARRSTPFATTAASGPWRSAPTVGCSRPVRTPVP